MARRAGGGFFTGWKGISVGVATVAAVAGLVGTGIAGSESNKVILGLASSQFVGEGALCPPSRWDDYTVSQEGLCYSPHLSLSLIHI